MTVVLIDDHLLRDVLTGEREPHLGDVRATSLATTGLWLSRLSSAWASSGPVGKLSAPVASLPTDQQQRFREQLLELPEAIEVVPLRRVSWRMAELQHHHRAEGRQLSAAMVEALASAEFLGGEIAVSARDVGPALKASAEASGITFHIL
jgi:hypothetical protein